MQASDRRLGLVNAIATAAGNPASHRERQIRMLSNRIIDSNIPCGGKEQRCDERHGRNRLVGTEQGGFGKTLIQAGSSMLQFFTQKSRLKRLGNRLETSAFTARQDSDLACLQINFYPRCLVNLLLKRPSLPAFSCFFLFSLSFPPRSAFSTSKHPHTIKLVNAFCGSYNRYPKKIREK